ncbi:hypothetical protein OE88DRAFT_1739549 [Heliocybe sulcata]|uniref:Cytochrome c oxidase subunit 8, mitochondrial n=1 Tax=Heliocybe sulcata TaxID=5364 RepID=A0A5C3MQC7_9AGAM|nr:hypothetical protein OE88DRAFT_1739549 [Heliocybe sulcata]
MLSSPRPSLPRAPLALGRRFAHKEVSVVYPYTFPFSYRNKAALRAKVFVFCTTSLCLPFGAAAYQLRKSGAGAQ